MTTADVDDIWFRTHLSLVDIGRGLALTDIEEDSEDYWAWIIGELDGAKLDVTRTHRGKASETDTRIFVLGEERFTPARRQIVLERLHALGISTVHYGTWKYLRGNEFEKVAIGVSHRDP